MKKINTFIFCLVISFLIVPKLVNAEEISFFDTRITINKDASVLISEIIAYDFGQKQSHGIFRDIPVEYNARGGKYAVRVTDVVVIDEKGAIIQFEKTRVGKNLHLKIGDPNSTLSGKKVYVIKYKISRVINYFSDHDEFYWNVTGNNWLVNINNASADVRFPEAIDAANIGAACFAGPLNSTVACQSMQNKGGEKVSGTIFSQSALNAGGGLTIVVSLPKGIVTKPSAASMTLETIKDNLILLLPIFVLIAMTILWYKKGRDPSGRKTIITQFDAPDGLTPMEIATILEEDVTTKSISSEIISLATRGYIKIERLEEDRILGLGKSVDYRLQKLKSESSEDLDNYAEKDLLKGIFAFKDDVSVNRDLKNKFYTTAEKVSNQVYETLTGKGYFSKNPEKTRNFYYTTGLILIVGPLVLIKTILLMFGIMFVASVILSGVIVAFFGHIMPAKTLKGVSAREHILGLKNYLSVAEKDRIAFHNAPEKNPERFEKLLPYAMVLGVEKEWAKQFEGIYNQNPGWYADSSGRNFNSILLMSDLGDFSSDASSALVSKPSSAGAGAGGSGFGGGGFSGGGFGGGGGGSW
ncbi:MAG: DUF2207 domain-containing protein [Candidatus Moranbacteria bacterium]|nr:DUF2207 domain-containing protein [Candidatus Moranbacteria bacterium]